MPCARTTGSVALPLRELACTDGAKGGITVACDALRRWSASVAGSVAAQCTSSYNGGARDLSSGVSSDAYWLAGANVRRARAIIADDRTDENLLLR